MDDQSNFCFCLPMTDILSDDANHYCCMPGTSLYKIYRKSPSIPLARPIEVSISLLLC